MVVLDASALLAYMRSEPGGQIVRQQLGRGAVCGAANWAEVLQKTIQGGRDAITATETLMAFDLIIEPVTRADAELAATMWADHPSWSLADRLCLALAHRLGAVALTADAAWGESDTIKQIR